MHDGPAPSQARWLRLQIGAAIVGVSTLHLAPPARGAVLLVPLTPFAQSSLVRTAVNAGASLMAPGPLPTSQVVVNERPGFLLAMLRSGLLPLAASSNGCTPPVKRS